MQHIRRLLSVATTGVFLCALVAACTGTTPEDDSISGQDTEIDDSGPGEDIVGDDTAPPDYGEITIKVLPPASFCGCSGVPGFQTEETLCGWFLKDSLQFRVQAEYLRPVDDTVNAENPKQVRLFQHWPADPGGGIPLGSKSLPEPDGLYTFELNATYLTLADPTDGTYWLRIEVEANRIGPDGLPMTREFVIPLVVDTQGPELNIIAPSSGQKLSNSASIAFTAEDDPSASGLEEYQVLILQGQEWNPMDVTWDPPSSDPGAPIVGTLDLMEQNTQDTLIRVEGTDCLGNVSTAAVEVRIIAIPRFVEPPTIEGIPDDEDVMPIFGLIYATQGDGISGDDPTEPPLDLLLTSNIGAYVAWGNPDGTFDPPTQATVSTGVIDVRFRDMNGDAVPDLILLSTDPEKEEHVVSLWMQDTTPGVKPKGARSFQLHEKRNVQVNARKMDIADVTGNGRPDILVVSSEQNETLYVLHHTGKTIGEVGGPSAYLDYPLSFTGVTGGIDIGHVDANMDGSTDLVIGREGVSAITTFLNDGQGEFDIGVDSLIGFGSGTAPFLVTNLDSDDAIADLIVYHGGLQALVMVMSVDPPNGYFDLEGIPLGQTIDTWGNTKTGSQIEAEALAYSPVLDVGPMVMLNQEIGGFVRGQFDNDQDGILDLAVTTPGDKLLRIYKGDPTGVFQGMFRQERFLNAGTDPGALASADFNGDGMDDIAVVNSGSAMIRLFMSVDGDYHASTELPMPNGPNWSAGQLEPKLALVADFGQPIENGSSGPDGREDLIVITEPVTQTWFLDTEEPGEVEEKEIGIPLLFTYLGLANPDGPDYSFVKSTVSYHMTESISEAVVGDFDGDYYLDIAVSNNTNPGGIESGANFDILRGGLSPLVANSMSGENIEKWIAGRFLPLGGFVGPQSPRAIDAAPLNGADDLDDLVLIAPQVGDIADPATYQWARAVSYISRYDKLWNSCEDTYNQVSFKCCAPVDPALPCEPSATDICLFPGSTACEGAFTGPDEVGYGPIKVVVDYISYDAAAGAPDDVPDVIVLNQESHNFSYFIGHQTNDSYAFQTAVAQPNMYAVGAGPVDMDVGDLDGDMIPDVVVALQNSLVITYGQDDPIHHFETAKALEKGPDSEDMSPTGVLMADVNLDGFMDIVTSSTSESRIWIYISAGDRDYLGPYPFECGTDPIDVVTIDWSDSGDSYCPHLAVVNAGSRSISLLRNERCD